MLLLPVLTTLLLTFVNAAVAHAARWTPPLAGAAVAREFDFDETTPFVRGRHRGVSLTGVPGTLVRAPCSGRVTFAGRHPRLGRGLALRCGALVATEFGLERPDVRCGALVAARTAVGRLGRGGVLYLGARRASRRWGYRDPLALLGAPAPVAPPHVAPPARTRRAPRRGVRPPRPPRPPVRARGAPLIAWTALAVAGVGAGAGVGLRRRGRDAASRAPVGRRRSGQPTH